MKNELNEIYKMWLGIISNNIEKIKINIIQIVSCLLATMVAVCVYLGLCKLVGWW
jgi:hypothetical protein